MPMDITEFEALDADEDKTTAECIIEFLLANQDQAFTRGEIASAIDRDPNTVGSNLSRLKDRGLVRHRRQHWALTDDLELLERELRHSQYLTTVADTFGPLITSAEEASAWSDAQPDRSHPSETDDDTADDEPITPN